MTALGSSEGAVPSPESRVCETSLVELTWGMGPATSALLAQIDVHTIGQLAKLPECLCGCLLIRQEKKLTALAWNRDPREIKMQSAGAPTRTTPASSC